MDINRNPYYTKWSDASRADKIGGIASALPQAADLFLSAKAMGDEVKGIPTMAPTMERDFYGRPAYNLGQFAAETSAIRPQGATGGEVLGSAAKGAGIGTTILPGVGTAIGAGVGAVTSLLGGRRRKRIMTDKKREAQGNLQQKQAQFNTANQAFAEQQLAMEQFNQQNNDPSRYFNLYGIPQNLGF